jgi:hypothetical protein
MKKKIKVFETRVLLGVLVVLFTTLCLTACGGTNISIGKNEANTKSMADTLTPPGAKVVSRSLDDGILALTSDKSLSELITFYEGALKKIGAKEKHVGETDERWSYEGTYDDEKYIIIGIFSNESFKSDGLFISISYEP